MKKDDIQSKANFYTVLEKVQDIIKKNISFIGSYKPCLLEDSKLHSSSENSVIDNIFWNRILSSFESNQDLVIPPELVEMTRSISSSLSKHVLMVVRFHSDEEGTYGVAVHDRYPVCSTLELPWNDNKISASCIPLGGYPLHSRSGSNKFKYRHFKVLSVPDRSGILIHRGNYRKDTTGCILVGSSFGANGSIVRSAEALKNLEILDKDIGIHRILIIDSSVLRELVEKKN